MDSITDNKKKKPADTPSTSVLEALEDRLLFSADLPLGLPDWTETKPSTDALTLPVSQHRIGANAADESVNDSPIPLPLDDLASVLTPPDSVVSDTSNTGLNIEPLLRQVKAANDPVVVEGGGMVTEGQSLLLTPAQLQAIDIDSPPTQLTYTVSNVSHGHFESTDNSGQIVTSFTQSEIDVGKIRFYHNGAEATVATFDYVLVDERAVVPAVGTYTFLVMPVNDAPLVADDSYNVKEDGSIDTALHYPLHITSVSAGSPRSLDAGDIDSDGDTDVIVAEFNGRKLAWHDNDGQGGFVKHDLVTEGGKPLYVGIVDLDQDGDRDIVATFTGQTNHLIWYENDGAENFTAHAVSTTIGQMVKVADIDGDGDLDLALAATTSVAWFENDGSGGFTQHEVASGVNGAFSVEIADLDADGDQDLVLPLTDDDQVVWYQNDGSENFSLQVIGAQDSPETIGVADSNGDGYLDVFSVTTDTPRLMRWYMNDGSQSFTPSDTPISVSHLYSNTASEVVDFDSDGDPDVLMASAHDDNIWLFENDGAGVYTAELIDSTTDFGTTIAAADIDTDGDLDIVTVPWNGVPAVRWFESIHSFLHNDSDPEGMPLNPAILSGPLHGALHVQPDGNFSYTPNGDFFGVDSFTYQATDGDGLSSGPVPVMINVQPINDAPTLPVNSVLLLDEGATGQVITDAHLNASDSDDTAGDIFYRVTVPPQHGMLVVDGTEVPLNGTFTQDHIYAGRVSYSHDGSETTTDSFEFELYDGGEHGAVSVFDTFNLSINPVDDAPLLNNIDSDVLIYSEGNAATVVDQLGDALLTDPDTTGYNGATLTGFISLGDNTAGAILGVRNEGVGSGQIGVDGSTLSYEGQTIGVVDSTVPLSITFNDAATAESVSATLRNITFHNSGANIVSTMDTHLLLMFSASDGGTATATTIIKYNPLPKLTGPTITLVEGAGISSGWVISISDISVSGAAGDFHVGVVDLPDNATLYSDVSQTNVVDLDTVFVTSGSFFWSLELHDPDWVGSTSFTLSATDAEGGVSYLTVPVSVAYEINDPPQLVAGAVEDLLVDEDSGITPLWTQYLQYSPGGGVDESGQALTFQVTQVPDPAVGNIVLDDDTTVVTAGSFYTLAQLNGMRFSTALNSYGGPETFSFTVTDNGTSFGSLSPQSISEALTVTVRSVNDAPQLTIADFPVTEGGTLRLSPDLLSVIDADTDALLTLSMDAENLASYPESFNMNDINQGAVELVHDGSDNPPVIRIIATDEFGASSSVNAGINFTSVNDAPRNQGTLPTFVRAIEDNLTPIPIDGLNIVDTDSGSGLLSMQVVAASGSIIVANDSSVAVTDNGTGAVIISGATATLNDWAAMPGSLSYLGGPNLHGSDLLYFGVTDNGNSGSGGGLVVTLGNAIVSIASVNDAPDGTDAALALLEDSSLTLQMSDFGFIDTDGHSFESVLLTQVPDVGSLMLNGVLVAEGERVRVSDINNGGLVYQAAPDFYGDAELRFQVVDSGGITGGGVDTDPLANVLTLTVSSVNDAPRGADGVVTLVEDSMYQFDGSELGFTDSGDNNQWHAVIVDSIPVHGALLLNGLSVADGTVVSAADILTGQLVYQAEPDMHGTGYASMSFHVQDDGGTAGDGVDTDPIPRTLELNVVSVNDAPIAYDGTLQGTEDIALVLTLADFAFSDAVDNPPHDLQSVIVNSLPGSGQLLLDGVPVVAGDAISATAIADAELRYVAIADGYGDGFDSFTFSLQDSGGSDNGGFDISNTATMIIDIAAVNDAPQGEDAVVVTAEDSRYTFARDDFGFTDPADSNQLLGIRVLLLPDAGLIKVEGSAVAVGDIVTATQIDNGSLVFEPASNRTGTFSGLGFAVVDNGGTDNGGVDTDPTQNFVSFDVPGVNDAPQLITGVLTVDEGDTAAIRVNHLDAKDSDNTATELRFTVNAAPQHGVVTFNGLALSVGSQFTLADVTEGRIDYRHNGSESADDKLLFSLSDGGRDGVPPVSGALEIEINEVIDPAPNLTGDSLSIRFGEAFSSHNGNHLDSGASQLAVAVLSGDPDLRVSVEMLPRHGTVELNADGSFSYVHDGSMHLQDSFVYRITNQDGMFSTATVQVFIEPPIEPAFAAHAHHPVGAVDAVGVSSAGINTGGRDGALDRTELKVLQIDEVSRTNGSGGFVSAAVTGQSVVESSLVEKSLLEAVASKTSVERTVVAGAAASTATAESVTAGINADGLATAQTGWLHPFADVNTQPEDSRVAGTMQVIQHNEQSLVEARIDDQVVDFEQAFRSTEIVVAPVSYNLQQHVRFTEAMERFANEVDEWRSEYAWQNTVVVDTLFTVSTTITVGVVASVFRSGSLAASLLATAPLWTGLDPIGYALKVDRQRRLDAGMTDGDRELEKLFD